MKKNNLVNSKKVVKPNTVLKSDKEMTKKDYLFLLRRVSKLSTLDKIIEHKEKILSGEQLGLFHLAADHRRVEIVSDKLFDKVPAAFWKLI